MVKLIFFSSLVLLALSITAVASGITSLQQALFFALVAAFFTVLVKGAIDGVQATIGPRRGSSDRTRATRYSKQATL